jgi:hypothetical protein
VCGAISVLPYDPVQGLKEYEVATMCLCRFAETKENGAKRFVCFGHILQ